MATTISLYIDPNGVIAVTIQMKMVADHIEQLQNLIAPQVQNVILMSQSLAASTPGVQSQLYLVQDQLNRFTNLSAGIAVSEMRSSAATLTQVAQQAATSAALLASLQWNVPDAVRGIAENTRIEREFLSVIEHSSEEPAWFSLLTDTTLEVASSQQVDMQTILADVAGNVFQAAAEQIPGVDIVTTTVMAMHFASIGMAAVLTFGAGFNADPAVAAQMQRAASNLDITAADADTGSIFRDLGGVSTDLVMGQWGNAGSDLGSTLLDSGKLLSSAPLYELGVMNTSMAASDTLVQNLPLPASFKNVYNQHTAQGMNAVNNASDFIITGLPGTIQSGWGNFGSTVCTFAAASL